MDFGQLLGLDNSEEYILMNTIYHKPRFDDASRECDAISLVYKHNKTGKKVLKTIENPKIEAYIAKEHVDIPNHLITIPIEDVSKVDLSYRYVLKEIAELNGKDAVNFYWDCIKNRNSKELIQLQKWNRVFSSDVDIEDFYRYKSTKYFGMIEDYGISKGFFDIEADTYGYSIDLKNSTGDAPVNAVTFIDGFRKNVYTLLLRNPNNPLIEEFEKDMDDFVIEMKAEFDKEFGSLDYKILMYDEEIELIKALFLIINSLKLDFIMAWNMGFDIPYLIHRITQLGYDPALIMCDPTFKYKDCFYVKDKRNHKIKLKTDYFTISSYTVYIDQMINYAAIRKAQAEIESYKLDFIGEVEVNANKLDYSDFATIRTLPYVNYKIFVKYNIRDTLIQYKIENKVNDIELLFRRAYDSHTRYNKVYKESIFLRNVAFDEFQDLGLVLGNNINARVWSDEPSEEDNEKFDGALVGSPKLNTETGVVILGKRSRSVHANVMDFDFSSLYPTIIVTSNIFPSTQIGRVLLDPRNITNRECITNIDKYDRGGKLIDDYEVDEPTLFGYRWLGLPSIEEMIDEFEQSLGDKKYRKVKFRKKDELRKVSFKRMGV